MNDTTTTSGLTEDQACEYLEKLDYEPPLARAAVSCARQVHLITHDQGWFTLHDHHVTTDGDTFTITAIPPKFTPPARNDWPAPPWPADDPELVMAMTRWAMSRGAIITRRWFGLPPREAAAPKPGERLSGLTRGQATVALNRLGYAIPSLILTGAEQDGEHTAARHIVTWHPNEREFSIIPAGHATAGPPDNWPGAREAFYRMLDQASAEPRTLSEHQAGWLRQIRDITADLLVTDAQAGGRIRALLYPAHIHDDDGTVEGCPGCFPPGKAIGQPVPDARSYPALDAAVMRKLAHDLSWLRSVIPVVDQALDDLAPPEYRENPLANMWRRFAGGPVSEAVEATDALNGMTGGNPRKGVTHSRTDLLAEAADTAFSALLAIQSQTKDIAETWTFFIGAAAKAYSRVPDANRSPESLADYYVPPEEYRDGR